MKIPGFSKLGATPHQIGMGLGWVAAMICISHRFNQYPGLESILGTAAFLWGTASALISAGEMEARTHRLERALREHGGNPDDIY